MKLIPKILALAYLSLLSITAWSSDFRCVHYDVENSGLACNSIRTMFQDSRGFLWVGTHKGLSRYDGRFFWNYNRNDFGLRSDYISALAEDGHGRIWIGTDNGLVIWDGKSFSKVDIKDRIYAIERDLNGSIWVGTRTSGIYLCRPGHHPQNIGLADDSSHEITSVYKIALSGNNVWIASYCDNIYYLDPSLYFSPVPLKTAPESDWFRGDDIEGLICVSPSKAHPSGLLYVAGKKRGLCEVDIKSGKVRTLMELSGEHRPLGLSLDSSNRLWLNATSGLFCYDTVSESITSYHSIPSMPYSLSEDFVRCSCIDNMGGLWIGTEDCGIDYLPSDQDLIEKYTATSDGYSLQGSGVSSFTEDGDGNIWIGTEHGGILRLNKTGELIQVKDLDIPTIARALFADSLYLWIGSNQGIFRKAFDGSIKRYDISSDAYSGSTGRILSFFHSNEGDLYATSALGVLKYDKRTDSFQQVAVLKSLTGENMVEDSSGLIWIATYSDGIYSYFPKSGALSHYCLNDGTSSIPEMVSSVAIDKAGIVWSIGYTSGFCQYNSETKRFSPAFNKDRMPELPSDLFFSAASDSTGHLWISSDKGLVRFDTKTSTIKTFTNENGLLDNSFRIGAFRAKDGRLLFASENGFIRFSPEDLGAQKTGPDRLGINHSLLVDKVEKNKYKSWSLWILLAVLTTLVPISLIYYKGRLKKLSHIRNQFEKEFAASSGAAKNLSDPDREFLSKIDAIISQNLSDPNFSNKQLESLLYMSHSTLNRKLNTLLDTTPAEYMKRKRLALAAHLLETTSLRVNEISTKVGFSSPSYFARCFKDKFGMLPLDYQAEYKKNELTTK